MPNVLRVRCAAFTCPRCTLRRCTAFTGPRCAATGAPPFHAQGAPRQVRLLYVPKVRRDKCATFTCPRCAASGAPPLRAQGAARHVRRLYVPKGYRVRCAAFTFPMSAASGAPPLRAQCALRGCPAFTKAAKCFLYWSRCLSRRCFGIGSSSTFHRHCSHTCVSYMVLHQSPVVALSHFVLLFSYLFSCVGDGWGTSVRLIPLPKKMFNCLC